MNLKLTKSQERDYVMALLTASTEDELMAVHKQYGQIDKYEEMADARHEKLKQYLAAALAAASPLVIGACTITNIRKIP